MSREGRFDYIWIYRACNNFSTSERTEDFTPFNQFFSSQASSNVPSLPFRPVKLSDSILARTARFSVWFLVYDRRVCTDHGAVDSLDGRESGRHVGMPVNLRCRAIVDLPSARRIKPNCNARHRNGGRSWKPADSDTWCRRTTNERTAPTVPIAFEVYMQSNTVHHSPVHVYALVVKRRVSNLFSLNRTRNA